MKHAYYCRKCGAMTARLPVGMVTCQACGGLGLRGCTTRPRRVRCPKDGCAFTGWDDGGVNPDLPTHMRREHSEDAA